MKETAPVEAIWSYQRFVTFILVERLAKRMVREGYFSVPHLQ